MKISAVFFLSALMAVSHGEELRGSVQVTADTEDFYVTADGDKENEFTTGDFSVEKETVVRDGRATTTFYGMNNNSKKEAISASIRCSSDYGLSYQTINKSIPFGKKVEMCTTSYNYVYVWAKSASCQWCSASCTGEENSGGRCYIQDLVDHTGGEDTYTAQGCPTACA